MATPTFFHLLQWGLLLSLLGQGLTSAFAGPPSATVAARVDRAIEKELFQDNPELAPRTDDVTFVRRVWLDLVGDIPSPEDVTAFALDPSEDKRARLVDELLASVQYGQNWSRYWRDVVFHRALEQRAQIAANAMEVDLAERLNSNASWDKIATEFITAIGDVRQNGTTAIIMAQDGRTEETTAEVSRIFLGIQIQCAQCHDHPYDRWKREQFHELAAFFPRTAVRPVRGLTKRSFEVYASDFFRRKRPRNNDNRPTAEHKMPDLDHPEDPGTRMEPRFFLTGSELPAGTPDSDRRQQLAVWLTDSEWFSVALVNRLWSELVGEGFYEPIDDIGPDREASSPDAIKVLADGFRQSGYDLKWVLKTICQTEAYQRESRPRRGPTGTPFVANIPQPLRSDQLLNALCSALEIDENHLSAPGRASGGGRRLGLRQQFSELFSYDPSISRESVSASIPQMLALMNSRQINRFVSARDSGLLGRLLRQIQDDEALVLELYLHCLSREPEAGELEVALNYFQKVGRRRPAAEDLLWCLINSAEFQYRK